MLQLQIIMTRNLKSPRKTPFNTEDWNAKLGPGAYKNLAGTVKRFGIGETNDDRGQTAFQKPLPQLG